MILAAFPSAPSQQSRPRRVQDEPPLRLSANLVTVLASVSDEAGNQINDLAARDFTILEDGVPQEIAGFWREGQVPLRLAFLFDASSSIRHRFDFQQRAAAQFFQQVIRPGDEAALFSVSTDPRLEAQLTPNVKDILDALARIKPGGATALYNAVIEAARYLRPAEGRRVIVILSDGSDTASSASLQQALAEAQRSDAVIYAVHSTGIVPSANLQDLAGETALKTLCEDTGGKAFFPAIQKDLQREARDLNEIYRKIAAEVRAQYVLTYYPKNDARDGRFRAIRVEVNRPGLHARARRGYYAPKD